MGARLLLDVVGMEGLGRINQAATNMLSLVDDLLDIATIESGQLVLERGSTETVGSY
jgi:signal transduction histidine kinase